VLEAEVQDMYRQVARELDAALHFAFGRQLALRLGVPSELLDATPAEARETSASASLSRGPRCVVAGGGRGR
jgi:hypothetical protein